MTYDKRCVGLEYPRTQSWEVAGPNVRIGPCAGFPDARPPVSQSSFRHSGGLLAGVVERGETLEVGFCPFREAPTSLLPEPSAGSLLSTCQQTTRPMGRETTARVPFPASLSSVRVPPWASTRPRAIGRPGALMPVDLDNAFPCARGLAGQRRSVGGTSPVGGAIRGCAVAGSTRRKPCGN